MISMQNRGFSLAVLVVSVEECWAQPQGTPEYTLCLKTKQKQDKKDKALLDFLNSALFLIGFKFSDRMHMPFVKKIANVLKEWSHLNWGQEKY